MKRAGAYMITEIGLGDSSGGGANVNYIQASPAEGGTVAAPQSGLEVIAWLTPAGPLNTFTFSLPAAANDRIGQRALIGCSQAVTDMVVENGGGTVYNPSVLFSEGDVVVFICVANGI